MTNLLKQIVKDIQYYTDKTIDEIAYEVGYSRAYFTDQVNKGTNNNLLKVLQEKYGNQIKQNVRLDTPIEDQKRLQVIKEYLGKLTKEIGLLAGLSEEESQSFFASSGGKKEVFQYLGKRKGKPPKRGK